MEPANLQRFLGCCRPRTLTFSEFVKAFVEDPLGSLRTSAMLISEAVHHFGFEIVVRSAEPTISYNVFKDPFSGGTNAVFGQEHSIKQLVDVVESIGKESSPQRGIVLVGPTASGKTNIVDLIGLALEEYSKNHTVKLYSFYFRFENDEGRGVEVRPNFRQNPILLFPTTVRLQGETTHPRQELFEHVNAHRKPEDRIVFPTYYQNAYIDKRSLDIIEKLQQNPRNRDKTLFDVLETYVRVEEIDFSNAQAKGIANIDDMRQLRINVQPVDLGPEHKAIVSEHLPGAHMYEYQGALIAANRGLLHIHDAFGAEDSHGPSEDEYKPLLMLLGSGKASVEATQTPIDATVIATANLEEMERLERQLTSSKLLDRIDEIGVNYLLDARSEMDILKRDMATVRERYDIDPNLLTIAAYFSVLTRLLPPVRVPPLAGWSDEKKKFYLSVTPEQKLFIYSARPADPLTTIRNLPEWHPFRSELLRLGISIDDPDAYAHRIATEDGRRTLDETRAFTPHQLEMIDDDFMRALWNEHPPDEGRGGISVRQLQNLMRDTIAHSNGLRVHVSTFLSRLQRAVAHGTGRNRWVESEEKFRRNRPPVGKRLIGETAFDEGEGDYLDLPGLTKVVRAIYSEIIRREITMAAVNRDPEEIARDLRKYLQHVLLLNAVGNRAFAHIMVPRFSYFDPYSGTRVHEPDMNYLRSIEEILAPDVPADEFRREMAERFLDASERGELRLQEGKTVVSSREDNLLTRFGREYSRLASHRRAAGDIDPKKLSEAFFQKRMASDKDGDGKVEAYAEEILRNMEQRFQYSRETALDTILFALRKRVVDFTDIIS